MAFCYRRNRDVSPQEDEVHAKLLALFNNYVTEMEGYSYFGSNPGIPADSLEELADEVIEQVINVPQKVL